MKQIKPIYIWHFYHNLLLTGMRWQSPIKSRRNIIKYNKHPTEHTLRFRLLKRVKGKLPKEFTYSYEHENRQCSQESINKFPGILRLHKKECVKDCPWDGHSIFSVKEEPWK